MAEPTLKERNRLALKYFSAAIFLFIIGYALAWADDQPFVKGVLHPSPKPQSETSNNSPAPAPGKDNSQTKASTKPGKSYTVQPGDTISGIAGANGISFEELAQYNNIPYPYTLTVGQVIIIPGK